MAKVIEKSAKTVEDALKAALEELGVNKNEVEYEIIEEASKGFLGLIGTKPAKIRVTVKENNANINKTNKNDKKSLAESADIEDVVKDNGEQKSKELNDKLNTVSESSSDEEKTKIAKNFLQDILNKMKINANVEVVPSESEYILNVYGENLGILIGKHGQTLDALQYLVNLAGNRNETQRTRFIVDIENYRVRRIEILQNLAKNLADRAIRLNQDVRLEPMNRHERKVIHTTLQDNEEVTTHSVGEDPYRYIIISPKKYGKVKN